MNHEDFDPLSPDLYSGFGDDDDGLRFMPKMPTGPDLGAAAPVSLQVECNSEVRNGEGTKVGTSQDDVGSFGARMNSMIPPMAAMAYIHTPQMHTPLHTPPQILQGTPIIMTQQPMMVAAPIQMQMHVHPASRLPPPDYNIRKSEDTYDTRCNIYVASMPRTFDDHKLAAFFSRFGPIVSAKVMCDHSTGVSKGYGFVLFKSEECATRAVNEMAGQQVEGMRIQCRWAHFDATPTTRSTSYAVGTTQTGSLAINTAETAQQRMPQLVHPPTNPHQAPPQRQGSSNLSSPQGSFTSNTNNSPGHAPPPPAYGSPADSRQAQPQPVLMYAQQPAPMMVQYPMMGNGVQYMMPMAAQPYQAYPQMVMMPDPSMMAPTPVMQQQQHQQEGFYMVPASATTAPPPGAIFVPSRRR
eukprot:GILJ01020727.1.p1 GENE.GILJ01020727.1~~GILJ01020727.1.p1  ORF type:complete len:410 (+),score=62.74 GILJ01020727.1:175-1404(+)